MGETSRSLLEGELEHQSDALGRKGTSHRRVHVETAHQEMKGVDPNTLFEVEIKKCH